MIIKHRLIASPYSTLDLCLCDPVSIQPHSVMGDNGQHLGLYLTGVQDHGGHKVKEDVVAICPRALCMCACGRVEGERGRGGNGFIQSITVRSPRQTANKQSSRQAFKDTCTVDDVATK